MATANTAIKTEEQKKWENDLDILCKQEIGSDYMNIFGDDVLMRRAFERGESAEEHLDFMIQRYDLDRMADLDY